MCYNELSQKTGGKNTMKTTTFYGIRKQNYWTNGLGHETLTIFENGTFYRFEKNTRAGYCKDEDGRRISRKKFDELKATCKYAF